MEKENHLVKRRGQDFYRVRIGRLWRNLPLFEVAPQVRIALFNILGDTKVVREAAKILAANVPLDVDFLITPEVKSIPLAYELSRRTKIPYIVARKHRKPYMLDALKATVLSITTGKPQTLWLDGKDINSLRGKRVVLVDDVVSTGSTFLGLEKLMKLSGAKVVGRVAIFSEGDGEKWAQVIKLGHLPIFEAGA